MIHSIIRHRHCYVWFNQVDKRGYSYHNKSYAIDFVLRFISCRLQTCALRSYLNQLLNELFYYLRLNLGKIPGLRIRFLFNFYIILNSITVIDLQTCTSTYSYFVTLSAFPSSSSLSITTYFFFSKWTTQSVYGRFACSFNRILTAVLRAKIAESIDIFILMAKSYSESEEPSDWNWIVFAKIPK